MEALKPCLFCGNAVTIEEIPLRHYAGCFNFDVRCDKCGYHLDYLTKNDTIYRSEEEARQNVIDAWNKRADL